MGAGRDRIYLGSRLKSDPDTAPPGVSGTRVPCRLAYGNERPIKRSFRRACGMERATTAENYLGLSRRICGDVRLLSGMAQGTDYPASRSHSDAESPSGTCARFKQPRRQTGGAAPLTVWKVDSASTAAHDRCGVSYGLRK